MLKLFNKKKHHSKNLYLGTGRIIKIYHELSNVEFPNPNDFGLKVNDYNGVNFTCLQSYDNAVIIIPQKLFEEKGYDIFGDYAALDPKDNKYIINITQFIYDYRLTCNTLCKSSQTVVPTYIDICKVYICRKDKNNIYISTTDHIDKRDSIYNDLSQLRQIKERLHL